MAPLMKDKPELLEFNWFLCARPFKDNKGNHVVDVGRYALFFDTETGKSYYVTFDATENGPCLLMVVSHPDNKSKHPELNKLCGWDKSELSTECDLRNHPEKAFAVADREGYCGVAMKVERCSTSKCRCDLTCETAVFIFDRSVVEESKRCPYIEFARNHATHLRKVIPKGFPSSSELKRMKPGKDSLRLRQLLSSYFE